MSANEDIFNSIVEEIEVREDVAQGPMMSSPGIRYKEKVFAFFFKDKMCFRLGDGFDLSKYGISDYELLNPFKNKGPLKGWYIIDENHTESWKNLTEESLILIQKSLDK